MLDLHSRACSNVHATLAYKPSELITDAAPWPSLTSPGNVVDLAALRCAGVRFDTFVLTPYLRT